MSEQAIVLNELTKHYGKHRGINNLSFSVNQGEVSLSTRESFSALSAPTVRVSPPRSAP